MKPKPAGHVDDLIAELDEVGLAKDSGAFTLDREKARDKMRQFQLADPRRYVLELVQAAVRKGATRIRFDIDADDMRMRFDGRPFGLADFELLYNALLSRVELPDSEAVRQLALGLNAAMALNPRWIRVWSGAEGQGAYLEMRPGTNDHFEAAKGMADGTLVHVKGRFRPGLAVTFFQNLRGTLPEEALLRERCRFSRATIDLEGQLLSTGLVLPDLVGQCSFTHIDADGVVAWSPNQANGATIHLVRDGVWISTHVRKGEANSLVAVLDSPHFRKDVSQSDVVKDEAYEAAIARMKAGMSRSVAIIARQLREAWNVGEAPPFPLAWGVELCMGALGHLSAESLRGTDEASLGYHLARVPLWSTLTGELLDTQALLAEIDRRDRLDFSTRAFKEQPDDPELSPAALTNGERVLHPSNVHLGLLRSLFGERVKDVTKTIGGRIKAVQNRRQWKLRPAKPRLEAVVDARGLLTTQTIEGASVRGEVGLWATDVPASTVFFLMEGHALCRVDVELPLPGLQIVLDAPFRPSARFDNVQRDAAYVAALGEAFAALPALFERVAGLHPVHKAHLEQQRRLLRAWVTALGLGDLEVRFFEALGIKGKRLPVTYTHMVAAWQDALVVRPDAETPPPALVSLPLFPCMDGCLFSLADLWERQAAGASLRFVRSSLVPVPGRVDPVLQLAPEEARALSTWFRDLDDASKDYAAWQAEAKFMAKPEEPVRLGGRDLTEGPWRVRLQGEGLEGEVALTYAQTLGAAPPWPVRFMRQRRTLERRDVPFDSLSGAAVVSSDTLTPDEEYDGLVEDEHYLRVLAAIHRAAFGMLSHLADHHEQILEILRPTVSALLVRALEAAVPTRTFGRALLALRSALPTAEEADVDYQDLVDLLSSGELILVDAALSVTLEAGELPTRDTVLGHLPADVPTPERPPRLSLAFPGGQDRFNGDIPLPRPERCPFTALRMARVLVDDDGNACSLNDALVDFDARGQVLVLTEPGAREAVPDQRIFLVTGTEEVVLRHIFGHESMVDGTPFVEAARQRRAFEEQMAVERPTLPDDAILARRVLRGSERQGEVGLVAQAQGGSWIRIFFQGRQLCQVSKFSPLGLFAAVNDDHLTPTKSFTEVEHDAAYDALVAACEAQAPDLLVELAGRYFELSALQRQSALLHVLTYLGRPPLRPLWAQVKEPDAVLTRWLGLPVFEGPMGHSHSLAELLEAEERHEELVFLPAAREGVLRDPSRCLILAEGLLIKRLRALFRKVSSYERQWEADQTVAALEARGAPQLQDPDRIRRLASAKVVLGTCRGSLFLPESAAEPLVVRFGAFGLELFALKTSGLYPCAGQVLIPEDQAKGEVNETQLAREIDTIPGEARGLYRSLTSRFTSFREESELKARTREVLRPLLDRLLGVERRGGPIEPKDRKIFNQLTYLPLLTVDGEQINLVVARKRRPPALAGLGYWEEDVVTSGGKGGAGPIPGVEPVQGAPPPSSLPFAEVVVQGLGEGQATPASDAGATLGNLAMVPSSVGLQSDKHGASTLPEGTYPVGTPSGLKSSPAPILGSDPLSLPTLAYDPLSTPTLAHEPPSTPPPAPEPPPEPQVPPEELLIEALRAELDEIAAPQSAVLRHVRLRAILPEARVKEVPVSSTEEGIFLHLGHPLVSAAMAEGARDPLLVTYLASALCTAVNIHLEEVTDEDEAVFQSLLLGRVSRSVAAAANAIAPDPLAPGPLAPDPLAPHPLAPPLATDPASGQR